MKTTKLVFGIIMIVLGVIVFFQSMLAGVGNAIVDSNSHSGSAGVFVSILYVVAIGIVYLATRKSLKMGGDSAGLVIAIVAWLLGAFNVGIYKDLQVWAWVILIVGVMFFTWHFIANRKNNN